MTQESGRIDRESPLRSILKALSYRLLGTLTTGLLTYAVTGDMSAALAVGASEPLLKMALYYLHERAWTRVPHGSVRGLLRRG